MNIKEILSQNIKMFKETIIIVFISVLSALIFNSMSEQQIPFIYHPYTFAQDRQLTIDDIKRIHKNKEALFIDARSVEEYQEGHISDAINIPAGMGRTKKMEMLNQIPKDLQIIVYCEDSQCHMAERLAKEMQYLKFASVTVFEGGWKEWCSKR